MKKKLILAFVLIMVFPTFFFFRILIGFPYTPDQLIVKHQLEKADLIVIASGEMERVEYGFALAKQGYADTVFYSSGYLDKYQREYISRNMVEGVELVITTNSISTYTDAVLARGYVEDKNVDTIILVTSPYHSYRVYKTFSKVMPDKKLISVPVEGSFFQLQEANSAKDSFSHRSFRSEQFKYLFYAVRYGI